jgi:hypothetical protein
VNKDLAVTKPYVLAPALLLLALARCGGGSVSSAQPVVPPVVVTATTLAYADPASGTYLLKKNAALSTPASHLVLDLWGPATVSGSGVAGTFTLDAAKAAWSNVNAGDAAATLVANGTVFALGSGTPILKGKVTGGVLAATVAEKGLGSPKALNGPLLRIALDLKAGQGTTAGTAISLTADGGKAQVLLGDGTLPAITVAVGTLTAQ